MIWAAKQEDPIYLKLLLDHGGDPNTRNGNDETMLFQSFIWHNQWKNVQLLVEHGADVNSESARFFHPVRLRGSRRLSNRPTGFWNMVPTQPKDAASRPRSPSPMRTQSSRPSSGTLAIRTIRLGNAFANTGFCNTGIRAHRCRQITSTCERILDSPTTRKTSHCCKSRHQGVMTCQDPITTNKKKPCCNSCGVVAIPLTRRRWRSSTTIARWRAWRLMSTTQPRGVGHPPPGWIAPASILN